MRFLYALALGSLLSCLASGAEVYGVFSDLELPESPKGIVPDNLVRATLSWRLPADKYEPGDTFKLTLPCTSTEDSAQTLQLSVGGINYATCEVTSGDGWLEPQSEYRCRVLPSLVGNIVVSGKVTFPLRFILGGARTETSMTCAKKYTIGKNLISWSDGKNDITTTATFAEHIFEENVGAISNSYPSHGTLRAFWLVKNYCPKGYQSIPTMKKSHLQTVWYVPTVTVVRLGTGTRGADPSPSLIPPSLAIVETKSLALP